MLVLEDIVLDIAAENAEQAIRIAGKCLLQAGAVEAEYIDAMVKNWQENGPYFVLAPGLALPHARPECGARQSRIAIVRLTPPVAFGAKENDPVSLVIALAASNSDKHIELMQTLTRILGDEEKFTRLKNATDKESIVALFDNTVCKATPKVTSG